MPDRDDLTALLQLQPKSVCLIKPSSLGDIVHALPVLCALKERMPDARFTWVVNRGLKGLLEGHPLLDDLIVFEREKVKLDLEGALSLGRLATELRRRNFDVVLDLQGLLRSALMTAATRAPVRVGLDTAREGATRFYSHRIPGGQANDHAVDRLLRFAEAFGASTDSPRFVTNVSAKDRKTAADLLAGVPRPILTVNLGARWLTKRWPPRSFAEIARRAVEERGAGLVAVGANEDRPLVEDFLRRIGSSACLDLSGKTDLGTLAAVAAESDVFLSNDSGPLHLAAASGARVVGVYTCTSPRRTGPYGPRSVAVQSCLWCAPSFLKKCDRLECMSELSPERVWPAVSTQLAFTTGATVSAA